MGSEWDCVPGDAAVDCVLGFSSGRGFGSTEISNPVAGVGCGSVAGGFRAVLARGEIESRELGESMNGWTPRPTRNGGVWGTRLEALVDELFDGQA